MNANFFTVLWLTLLWIPTDCRQVSSYHPTRRDSAVLSRRRCELGITRQRLEHCGHVTVAAQRPQIIRVFLV